MSEPILPLVNKNINSTIAQMVEIKQEDAFGCGVACTASVLRTSYQETLTLFQEGRKKAEKIGFFCREIVEVLAKRGLVYEYKHIDEIPSHQVLDEGTIVFLRQSEKYPNGHYLVKERWGYWMDPWYNFPDEDRRAGSVRHLNLPEGTIYVIYPVNP